MSARVQTRSVLCGSCVTVLLILGLILPTVSSQSSQFSASLHLAVDLGLLKEHKVRVSGNYSNLQPGGELRLALGPSATGRYHTIAIEFLKAADSEGRTLSVQRRPQTSPSSPEFWVVAKGQARFVHVEYLLTLNYYAHDQVDGYLGYAGTAYVISWAGWVFLLPDEYQSNPSYRMIRVSFSTPAGWEVVTPWVKQADGSFIDTNAYHFQRSTFGVGPYDVRTQVVDGTLVTVAMNVGFDSRSRDQLARYSFAIFDYVFKLFRIRVLERYLVIYVTIPESRRALIGLLEASDSQGIGYYPTFDAGMLREFTHRVFHTWNAFRPFGMANRSDEELWFVEGTNNYYDAKAIRDLGLISSSDFLQREIQFYLYEIVGTRYDMPLSSVSMNDPYPLWRLPYRKGALVSFMLDELIKRLSDGKHSLADLLAIMYERFRDRRCCYSNRDISAIARQLTGFGLSRFFQAYIYGTDRLPLGLVGGRVSIDWPALLSKINVSLSNTTVVQTTTTSAQPSSTTTASTRTSSSPSIQTAVTSNLTIEKPEPEPNAIFLALLVTVLAAFTILAFIQLKKRTSKRSI